MPALGHIYGEGWKGNGELCSPTIVNPLNEHNQPRQYMELKDLLKVCQHSSRLLYGISMLHDFQSALS